MRKILISAALIAAAAVSAPAAAQFQGGYGNGNAYGYNNRGGQGVDRELQQVRQQIDRLAQRRLISGREYQSLQREVQNIQRREFDYARNGLNQREFFDLQNRIQNLRQRLQRERREGRDDRRDDRRYSNRGW